MISAKHRFHGLGSLRYVYSKGQTVRGQNIALKYAINQRRNSYRLAVVVSKKVNKSAVVRNRIRRRIYELVRAQESFIGQPLDLVITVYSEQIADMSSEDLDITIKGLLQKAKAISK